MTMNRKIVVYLAIAMMGCNSGKRSNGDSIINVDFKSFKQFEFSKIEKEVIKEKKYINLSADNEAFLFNRIDNIKIHNNRIFIQDERTKKLLVFDMKGKGITKVGSHGRGPGEFLNLSDFDIDNDGYIYVIDGQQDKMNVYRPDYSFLKTMPFVFETDIIKCLANKNLLLGLSSWNTESKYKLLVTDTLLNPVNHYFEYDEYVNDNFWLFSYFFTESDNRILYNRPVDNHVHIFTTKGDWEKTLYFDFGSRNVPNMAKKDIETHLEDYLNYCTIGDFTFLYDKYIGGTLFNKRQMELYLLDTLSRTVYLKEKKETDIEKYLGYFGKTLVSYLDPGKFINHLPSRETYPNEVYEHLKNGNFVLCLYNLY